MAATPRHVAASAQRARTAYRQTGSRPGAVGRGRVDGLLVVASRAALQRARYQSGGLHTKAGKAVLNGLRSFLDALPPAEDATARRRLEAWGLRGDAGQQALPDELPRDLDEALALLDALGFDGDRGEPTKGAQLAEMPQALRDFYARHDHLGPRIIVAPGQLAEVKDELRAWIEGAKNGEVSTGDLDVRTLSRPEELVPFGNAPGGDYLFFDPAFTSEGALPVLRFVHEEGPTCRVEASSLPSFLAAHGLRGAFGLGLRGDEVDALVKRDRARVAALSGSGARPTRARSGAPRGRPRGS
jgi:hypothetical protein